MVSVNGIGPRGYINRTRHSCIVIWVDGYIKEVEKNHWHFQEQDYYTVPLFLQLCQLTSGFSLSLMLRSLQRGCVEQAVLQIASLLLKEKIS